LIYVFLTSNSAQEQCTISTLLIDKLLTKSEASISSGDALASCLLNTCSENESCERDCCITCRISSRSESLSSMKLSPGTPCIQELNKCTMYRKLYPYNTHKLEVSKAAF
jgi:hypothetical protein